jgi:hypothetical protein
MAKLKVREIAESQGMNMSQLQKQARVGMQSVRRYWYNSRDGSADGRPLKEVDLAVLTAIAQALGVGVNALFDDSKPEDDSGAKMGTQLHRRAMQPTV